MTTTRPFSIAFFDVDETLISIKSMFDFHDFFLDAMGHPPEERREMHAAARALITSGLPREQGNRLFYQRFAGYRVADVAAAGRDWFARHLGRGGLFHTDVLDALREHTAAGTTTVLVSGSFSACLDPVAEYSGADVVLCTELAIRDGRYTGDVERTMIGDAKADAARRMIGGAGVPADACWAYGDHTSDLGLLESVGHPVVVGTDIALAAIADAQGWRRLAGAG